MIRLDHIFPSLHENITGNETTHAEIFKYIFEEVADFPKHKIKMSFIKHWVHRPMIYKKAINGAYMGVSIFDTLSDLDKRRELLNIARDYPNAICIIIDDEFDKRGSMLSGSAAYIKAFMSHDKNSELEYTKLTKKELRNLLIKGGYLYPNFSSIVD